MSPNRAYGLIPTYEYPAGHLNHLNTEESKALQDFKALCEKSDYCSPVRYDEETLLRFLRARRFVAEDAFQQFRATEEWRKEQDISRWYETIDVDDYEATRVLYTHWTGRRDKRGIPLYVFQIGDLDSKKMAERARSASQPAGSNVLDPKLRRLFATYEHLTNFVFPLCSSIPSQKHPETPISQTCNIVDMSGVGLRQFWSLKDHLQAASTLATAHYPETLGRTFIIGAPSFFPTIWNWLKNWFDPVTVSKIYIIPHAEITSTLEMFIEPNDIPKRYGGTLDWKFGHDPLLDPKILEIMKMKDGVESLPKGPLRWKKSDDGSKIEAHAVGSKSGNQRDQIIGQISSEVFTNSFNPPKGE